MIKKNKNLIFLICIVFLASFLRLYKLDQLPNAFTHDETVLGYTAYSFLKTGADEKGNFLPIALHTFGNWTLPMYSYIAVIPVAIIGLNEFAVRLPSALSGIISTVLLYGISYQLFKKKHIALLSAFFFALSPWSIYYSRLALETNLATAFFLGGIYTFLQYIESKKTTTYLVLAAVLFSLTLFTYFTYVIVTPLFVLLLITIHRKYFFKDTKIIIAGLLFLLCICISILSVIKGSSGQLGHVSIFTNKDIIYNRVEVLRTDKAHEDIAISRVFHNKFISIPYHYLQNYIASFSPQFLFDKGGVNSVNNLGHFGNFYLFDVVLLFVGFCGLLWYREKSLTIIFPWIVLSPLASAMTVDAPSSTRLLVMLPAFLLIMSYGAFLIGKLFTQDNILYKLIGMMGATLFLVNVFFFLEFYFIHLNHQRARYLHYGYKQAVEISNHYPEKNVVMVGPENFPYISFLFYTKYDPLKFRSEVIYYPKNKSGFTDVKSFGKYTFLYTINRKKLLPNTLYIDSVKKGDTDNLIKLPSGEPLFTYFVTN